MKVVYTGVDSGVMVPGIGEFHPGEPVELAEEVAKHLIATNRNFREHKEPRKAKEGS